MNHQFCKYATKYNSYNIIQQIVSKALIRDIKSKPKRILELGCGSGQVFKYINWDFEYYKAIDISQEMCKLHPKTNNVELFCFDFDSEDFFKNISKERYDMVLSSSALQWSKNIENLVYHLSCVTENINVALFTSNTFKTIQNITKEPSPILSQDKIKQVFSKYFDCKFEILNYKLEFTNKKEMFKYIKNSGVNSKAKLSFKKAKKLYLNYKLNYLEFEVIFIKT
jgi:malonyl-CoA O-methyltransferase